MIELTHPAMYTEVSLQTAEQKEFLKNEERRINMDGALTFTWYDLQKEGVDQSVPMPVSFHWKEDIGEDGNPGYYCLLISENKDMQNPWVYMTTAFSHDVYNLKVGTKYYWCVQRNGKRSAVFSFSTLLELPRWIRIDGISNVRDMGGYKTTGGRIRQGLVYRGGEFERHMHLTPDGAEEIRRLAIRTEIDMRYEAKDTVDYTTAEVLGVKRVYAPNSPYGDVFNKEKKDAISAFFKVFTSADNYPVYFHCWGGADRAGTFAFLLGAFLGMKLENLIDEYENTTLSIWGIRTRNHSSFQQFLELLMALPGDSLQDKATVYLKKFAKLTDKQLNKIYSILIEPDTV